MATYERLDYGSADGCLVGGAATDKVGFYGKTPVVQTAVVAAATDAATVIVTANALRTMAINMGLMAAS